MFEVDTAASDDYLKDCLALLNMIKAMEGMMEQFVFSPSSLAVWDVNLKEYQEALQEYYHQYHHFMTTNDHEIFLSQASSHISLLGGKQNA